MSLESFTQLICSRKMNLAGMKANVFTSESLNAVVLLGLSLGRFSVTYALFTFMYILSLAGVGCYILAYFQFFVIF